MLCPDLHTLDVNTVATTISIGKKTKIGHACTYQYIIATVKSPSLTTCIGNIILVLTYQCNNRPQEFSIKNSIEFFLHTCSTLQAVVLREVHPDI